jgi:hypothetical protein
MVAGAIEVKGVRMISAVGRDSSPRVGLFVLFAAFCFYCAAAPLVINLERVHLRSGDKPEWEEFAAQTPYGRRLDLKFNAVSNGTEAALFVRQDEVRQDWPVELNGRRVGKLFTMETDLIHTLALPPGALREGENQLSIIPPRDNDDIFIREIVLNARPVSVATAEATLDVQVREGRAGVPCRVTIVGGNGELAALLALTNAPAKNRGTQQDATTPLRAVRPGVVYTGDGLARIGLRAGSYTIYASRGFEYSVATQSVQLVAGETKSLRLSLVREVPTPGMVNCDTHVHTFTHSRHGDATMEERMLTLAGEGIEFPIATDHNLHIDYQETARRMNVRRYFTPVTGNEVTTPAGHFNIFPVQSSAAVVDAKLTDWPRLDAAMRSTPNVRVVVLNHPRNVHNNFQPFAATNFNAMTGQNKRGPEFTFDAMEVLNSSAQQSDYMLVFRDWFALLNYGYRITGVGSSDSHDVSRYIVGQGRTYIESVDADVSRLDVAATCSNLVAGRALVSMGLLTTMTVNDRFRVGDLATKLANELRVRVKIFAPSWASANRVELFANGVNIRTEEISAKQSKRGVKADIEWKIPRPPHDMHLVAIATGPGVTAPFWATPKPYQPTSPGWTNRVIAITNPIWVDADSDGNFTSARTYARKLVEQHDTGSGALISALGDFDEAVSRQAAALCVAAGMKLDSPTTTSALRLAKPHVQRGFANYAATQ